MRPLQRKVDLAHDVELRTERLVGVVQPQAAVRFRLEVRELLHVELVAVVCAVADSRRHGSNSATNTDTLHETTRQGDAALLMCCNDKWDSLRLWAAWVVVPHVAAASAAVEVGGRRAIVPNPVEGRPAERIVAGAVSILRCACKS